MPGEHTREIAERVLGFDGDETERLISENVLFTWTEAEAGRAR
jgi:hypothetical protein